MKLYKHVFTVILTVFLAQSSIAQDYYFKEKAPFDEKIPTPEEFLGYKIGEHHTRHDLIVAYLTKLSEISDRASIEIYGKTHEKRKLVMFAVTSPKNLQNLAPIKSQHLAFVNTDANVKNYDEVPVIIQLGYNVHGNEPSSSEAALLTAYTLVASNSDEVLNYLNKSVIFIDPTINPDGRDRHTQWANQYQAKNLVSDNIDAEHNEGWPRGRTNHYWFDLNRDWLLAVHPESQGKLKWMHSWYPNVVTDFHEMGTNSHHFFEPMKPIGSMDPIMPKENYEDLNNLFAPYFVNALDKVGSLYYTKESFDGTYPGYGSSYPDLQGGLALLFEQASSRGHVQDTDYGKITFPFTIRNQYISTFATIKAAVENKSFLRKYQQEFFKSAVTKKATSGFEGYEFQEKYDKNREKAFVNQLLTHKIKVYKSGNTYTVPLKQPQHRMVQTMFETYDTYRDSVFYDASAWSLANFYNIKYEGKKSVKLGTEITSTENFEKNAAIQKTEYAYIIDWDAYNTPAALYYMQTKGLIAAAAFKPFSIKTSAGEKSFNYGSLLIPVSKQKLKSDEVYKIIKLAQEKFDIPVYGTNSGYSLKGIDLGSNNFRALKKPKVAILIGEGVNSYEAGEVWHLLDTRVHMPITKIRMTNYNSANLDKYNTLVMVSGNYNQLDSIQRNKLKDWTTKGNTLITIAGASKWVIDKKLVKESLTKKPKDTTNKEVQRLPYVDASENSGRERVGGAIFEVDLDVTHPLGFGYRASKLPVYKNNMVFLAPSKSAYGTVAKYSENPHIDGFISKNNLENFIKPSASLLVSKMGSGRVVLFADNPNFRGAWYGTNKLFLNALFLGGEISVPQ
ncbi:M14 family zinc carboxypeptidase [Polaribacter sp. Hel_I_88]|uniref:M14 family zinc carboxypeptidase n=1 Tax=Polaribacter sp. Hel_I_88 TaxID=1250006 RepID=UPI00047EF7DB|nr:M14 family zinc carboxypeptidase [Polaribacter sp. Hel_I_88]